MFLVSSIQPSETSPDSALSASPTGPEYDTGSSPPHATTQTAIIDKASFFIPRAVARARLEVAGSVADTSLGVRQARQGCARSWNHPGAQEGPRHRQTGALVAVEERVIADQAERVRRGQSLDRRCPRR